MDGQGVPWRDMEVTPESRVLTGSEKQAPWPADEASDIRGEPWGSKEGARSEVFEWVDPHVA